MTMKRGLKSFARAVRDGDIDKAEEMVDKIVQGDLEMEVWEGYSDALEGILEALNSDNSLTLPNQIKEEKFSVENLESIKEKMEERSSQEFRPEYELGFSSAWSDVLQVITEDSKGN